MANNNTAAIVYEQENDGRIIAHFEGEEYLYVYGISHEDAKQRLLVVKAELDFALPLNEPSLSDLV